MPTSDIDSILLRIDKVISANKRVEWLYIVMTTILFLSGITCFVLALVTREYAWSSPSVVTTTLLYWPLRQIKDIRQKNITLGIAPVLITTLPKEMAATEIRKLLQSLL